VDPLGRGSAENIVRKWSRPESADAGGVGGETPATRESLKAIFLDLKNNDSADDAFLSPLTLSHRPALSHSRWSLRSFEIDRVGMTRDKAKAIFVLLMLCIPHLVQIDRSFKRM